MKHAAIFLFAFALLGQAADAALVYSLPFSNTAGTVNVLGNAIESLGDDVTLAGTDRQIVSAEVDTAYYFDGTHPGSAIPLQLTLYDLTTPGTNGLGHVIATSSVIQVYGPGVSGRQDVTVTFPFAGETIPNSFYVAVSQNPPNAPLDNNFALFYGSSPTVGSTATTEFYRPYSSTNFSVINIGGVTGLAIRINAVPEPGTIALMGVGALGLVFTARRRRV